MEGEAILTRRVEDRMQERGKVFNSFSKKNKIKIYGSKAETNVDNIISGFRKVKRKLSGFPMNRLQCTTGDVGNLSNRSWLILT